jgi:polyphosphate kinase
MRDVLQLQRIVADRRCSGKKITRAGEYGCMWYSRETMEIGARFITPETSRIKLLSRYLTEARRQELPLLERVRALSGLSHHIDLGVTGRLRTGRRLRRRPLAMPIPNADRLHTAITALLEAGLREWETVLRAALRAEGIEIVAYDALDWNEKIRLEPLFEREIAPLCTPLAYNPGRSFPFVADIVSAFAVVFPDGAADDQYGFLNISPALPALLPVTPSDGEGAGRFVPLDELLSAHMQALFPGASAEHAHPFRVLRKSRPAGLLPAVAVEVGSVMPAQVRGFLHECLHAGMTDTFIVGRVRVAEMLDALFALPRPDLKFPSVQPRSTRSAVGRKNIFKAARRRDRLLHYPYDAAETATALLREAAADAKVVAIRYLLHELDPRSPAVLALLHAARAGKEVIATTGAPRSDGEESEIATVLALRKAGVHLIHSTRPVDALGQCTLVARRGRKGTRLYVQFGTSIATDPVGGQETGCGVITADAETGRDLLSLFNYLTGRAPGVEFNRLLVSGIDREQGVLQRIEREVDFAEAGDDASIVLQCCALTELRLIEALYRASAAGVRIDVIVEEACCLRPGVAGLSDHIRVVGLLGRFRGTSRICCFGSGSRQELFFGTDCDDPLGDLALLFPIADRRQRRRMLRSLDDARLAGAEISAAGDRIPAHSQAGASNLDAGAGAK